jgi:hypothetical protein
VLEFIIELPARLTHLQNLLKFRQFPIQAPKLVSKPLKIMLLWALCGFVCPGRAAQAGAAVQLDQDQLRWLGERIYLNECNAKPACLTAWNEGEEFPSLGIGHFIWYRQGQTAPFVETFPDLLAFLLRSGVKIPLWLQQNNNQPWPGRSEFLADRNAPHMQELRSLLAATRDLQTAFIVQRFVQLTQASGTPFAARVDIRSKLQAVAAAQIPYGLYALIDYVHFKGDGTDSAESYQGQGWGLLQVLEQMPLAGNDPLQDFVQSAGVILTRRVANAPLERHEQRWLAGWQHRLQTYLPTPKLP